MRHVITMRTQLLLVLLVPLLLFAGCASEREKGPMDPLWPEKGAPDILMALADDLVAYQSAVGRFPDTLATLDVSGMRTGGPYASHAFAYHPAGIGVLKEGWRVMVVDDRMRTENKVWCVVRPPVRLSSAPAMRVVQVPMGELRAAAAAASGIR